jgi:hypothetical protein
LSASLSDIEVSYVNLTQQLLTIETELRTSLEELHIKEQEAMQKQQKGYSSGGSGSGSGPGRNQDLSLLTENECDRLIRESQSAMVSESL